MGDNTLENDTIAQACQILSVYRFCAKQAKELKKCQAQQHGWGFGSETPCQREISAFKTCSKEKAEEVIGTLAKVASYKCADLVASYNACVHRRMSSEACEREDYNAMLCAAKLVVSSVNVEK